jgi:AcrR family transcriptional regulator
VTVARPRPPPPGRQAQGDSGDRSSLYRTFGGKDDLYVASLRRYLDQRSRPTFERLAADDRGLPAIADFFDRLIRVRCTGEFAGWGCFVANAHTQAPSEAVRAVLDEHHRRLRSAMAAALEVAASNGQLSAGVAAETGAELLALVAYAINLRSRSGADHVGLRTAVDAALDGLRA